MSRQLPSEEEALNLLAQVGCSKKVVEHCITVADLAAEIANSCKDKGFEVDVELVRIGALLHDIGRAKTHSIDHSIVGAQMAREKGLPSVIVFIIERHVGSGISAKEAEKLGWLVKNYIPESLEERIVAYADKLIVGSIRMPIEVAVERFRQDKNIPKASIKRFKQWHDELSI